MDRREILKAFATVPFLGVFVQRYFVDHKNRARIRAQESSHFSNVLSEGVQIPSVKKSVAGKRIRIGFVGNGARGPQLFRGLGFGDPDWVSSKIQSNGKPNQTLREFYGQEDLNVEITGVCDTFSLRAEEAAIIAASEHRSGGASSQIAPKIYPTYREMLDDDNLDAIVIVTPDHWHAKMAIAAAKKGKHVYLEKPMCQTIEEAKELRDAVKEAGVILQVGHQNRQQASYIRAKEIIDKGLIGTVSSIETYTNRNSDHGAWIREIDQRANETNVNWEEFLGDKEYVPFDPDRYFNWQKWFEYGTGPAGNQFTHEFDCVNQVMNLGIPGSVVAVGGHFFYKDPRDIPDVFNASFLYPDQNLTLTYDCSLKNSRQRDKTFLGEAGTMEVNIGLAVFPERNTAERRRQFPTEGPSYTYHPRMAHLDGVSSATSKYYEDRGFLYTYQGEKRIDTTYLHMKEWLTCIRNGEEPSCSVDKGFEETVTFRMANISYLEKRLVEWDPKNEKVI